MLYLLSLCSLGEASLCTLLMKAFPLNVLFPPLDSHEWDIPEWDGLDSRYEHCSFVPESHPQSLWVFAGAQQSGNRNCVQKLELKGKFQHIISSQIEMSLCVNAVMTGWTDCTYRWRLRLRFGKANLWNTHTCVNNHDRKLSSQWKLLICS